MPFFMKSETSRSHTKSGLEIPSERDWRFNLGALGACVLVAAMVAGFGVYRIAFNRVTGPRVPAFDLSSMNAPGHQPLSSPRVEAGNPCVVTQEYLDSLRLKDYEGAYGMLSTALRDATSFEEFVANSRRNETLFRDVKRYVFPRYRLEGDAASVEGAIEYDGGGRSSVTAGLEKQSGEWRIALVTVTYE
jgi:hypothetical protein